MKSITVSAVCLTALVLSLRVPSGTTRSVAHAQSLNGSGTVVAVQSHALLLRLAPRRLAVVGLTSSTRIASADNRVLAASSIRDGDEVSVATGSVTDLSQRGLSLTGLVDLSPDTNDSPEVMVVRGPLSVLAVVTGATGYADETHATTSLSDVADGDVLALQGIYDPSIGEMTQTSHVTRVGPVLKRHTTPSGTH